MRAPAAAAPAPAADVGPGCQASNWLALLLLPLLHALALSLHRMLMLLPAAAARRPLLPPLLPLLLLLLLLLLPVAAAAILCAC